MVRKLKGTFYVILTCIVLTSSFILLLDLKELLAAILKDLKAKKIYISTAKLIHRKEGPKTCLETEQPTL